MRASPLVLKSFQYWRWAKSRKVFLLSFNFLLLIEKQIVIWFIFGDGNKLKLPSEITYPIFKRYILVENNFTLSSHLCTGLTSTFFQYLGQGQEVAGRTILDEDLIQDLPIIARPGIILMPGQTLPMNFFHPTVMSLMKNLISGSKTFGVVHSRFVVLLTRH